MTSKVLGRASCGSPGQRNPMCLCALLKAHTIRCALFVGLTFACSLLVTGYGKILASPSTGLHNGEPASNISDLEKYHRQHPANAAVCNLLGMAYSEQGRTEEAVAMFKQSTRLAPDRPEAYSNLGAIYMRLGKLAEAEQSFRRALALNPDNPSTLYNMGTLLNARHEYSKARALLVRAVRKEHSSDIIFQLAISRAGLGKRKEALALLRSNRPPSGMRSFPWLRLLGTLALKEGDLAGATTALERALAFAPDDPRCLYALGIAHLRAHQVSKAVPLLEKSLTSVPPAERYVQIGSLLAENGATAEAEAEFDHAIAADPESYDAYFNLAIVRFRQKELEAAGQAATKALKLQNSAEAHNLLGDIREEQGRYKEALGQLQEAVRLKPDSEEYFLDLGLELVRHQNSNAAREVFLAARKRFPQSPRIAIGLGAADHIGGKDAEAVQALLTAAKLNPNYEPVYTFLGEAYSFAGSQSAKVLSELGNLAQGHTKSFTAQYYYGAALVNAMEQTGNQSMIGSALESLRRAAALRPGEGRTFYYLGEIDRLQGNIHGASQLYEKAVALDPTLGKALYRLGQAYVKMGRLDDAQRILARQRAVTLRENAGLRSWIGQIRTFTLEVRNSH